MSRKVGFNILVALTLVGSLGGVGYALTRFGANERLTAGAPQQTVVALWAVMDLLVVLVGVGTMLVLIVAWNGLKPEVVNQRQLTP